MGLVFGNEFKIFKALNTDSILTIMLYKAKTSMKKYIFILVLLLPVMGISASLHNKNVNYYDRIRIVTGGKQEGAVISANLYAPRVFERGRLYPAVIFVNSWGFDKYEYRIQAQRFAENGFIALSYSARGWGNSTGTVDVGGPKDMEDLSRIIDWLIKHTPTDPKRIGITGISYGGGIALLAAGHDARISAAAAMSPWTDLYHSLYINKTSQTLWINVLKLSANMVRARLGAEAQRYLKDILHYQVQNDAQNWARQRSPLYYIDALNRHSIPIYLSTNLQDTLFESADVVKLYEQLQTPFKRLDLNQGKHGTFEGEGLRHKYNYIWDHVLYWFQTHLQGKNVPADDVKPGITVQFPSDSNEHSAVAQNRIIELHAEMPKALLKKGASGLTSGASEFAIFQLLSLFNNKVSIEGLDITHVDKRFGILFPVSVPVTQTLSICGVPQVHLNLELISPVKTNELVTGQLIIYLYDVNPKHRARLISFAPITFYRDFTFNQAQNLLVSLRFAAYQLPRNHYLALGIGTEDPLFQSSDLRWRNWIKLDEQSPVVLTLPTCFGDKSILP